MKNSGKKVSNGELAWYIISGILLILGLAMIAFHLVGEGLSASGIKSANNWVRISENAALVGWSKMGWLPWGFIFLGVGLFILVVTCMVNSKKTDKDVDKETRRKQRLESIKAEDVLPSVREIEKPVQTEQKPE